MVKSALQILEGKLEATVQHKEDQDECGWIILNNGQSWTPMKLSRNWTWTKLDTYEAIEKLVEDRSDVSEELVLLHVNLLIMKTTADDDDEEFY